MQKLIVIFFPVWQENCGHETIKMLRIRITELVIFNSVTVFLDCRKYLLCILLSCKICYNKLNMVVIKCETDNNYSHNQQQIISAKG